MLLFLHNVFAVSFSLADWWVTFIPSFWILTANTQTAPKQKPQLRHLPQLRAEQLKPMSDAYH